MALWCLFHKMAANQNWSFMLIQKWFCTLKGLLTIQCVTCLRILVLVLLELLIRIQKATIVLPQCVTSSYTLNVTSLWGVKLPRIHSVQVVGTWIQRVGSHILEPGGQGGSDQNRSVLFKRWQICNKYCRLFCFCLILSLHIWKIFSEKQRLTSTQKKYCF